MHLPQLNINGTDPSDLLEDLIEAKRALEYAIEKLNGCSPHGRDYQTCGDGGATFYAAQREHVERIVAVRKVLAEVVTIAEYIA